MPLLLSGVRVEGERTESGGINTVYGVAGRRRCRCSSEIRVSLVTAGRNAVGKTAAAPVKILMRRSERGYYSCANC